VTAVAEPAVGDRAPVLRHELTRVDLARYAGASGDFFPLHVDDDYARAAGFDGAFAHGMFSAGLLATAVTNWFGIGSLRRFTVRFAAPAWPGEVLSSQVTITGVRTVEGGRQVDFACELVNEAGEVKVIGSGTAIPVTASKGNHS